MAGVPAHATLIGLERFGLILLSISLQRSLNQVYGHLRLIHILVAVIG